MTRSVILGTGVFVCLAMISLSGAMFGQSSTEGAIGGTVFDPVRAVVQKTQVTVRNLDTGRQDSGITDSDGRFRIIRLPPGTYRVMVNAAGFAPFDRGGVAVEVGRISGLDIVLNLPGHQEVVEVEGAAQVVETEQHDFSTNVNQTAIDDLPINGRRWSNFALLTAGATPDGDYGLISFRGISGLLNNNTVDGADNNQAFYSEERGRTRISYVISSAAIREFQVNTSNFSAEYGRAAGAVINAVTKSGTNNIHGRLFYFNRNSALSATNAFTRTTTVDGGALTTRVIKPRNNRHQFGGTVGGPIAKDKLFYFFSYDQQRHANPGVSVTSDPTFLTPITLATPPANATCNTSGLSAGQRLAACGITQAQSDATIHFLVGLTGPIARDFNEYTVLPKIDWAISRNHWLALSYNRMRWLAPAGVQTAATVTRARDGFGNDISRVDSLIGRLTSTFGTHRSNELRFQWGRDLEIQRPQTPLPGQPNTVDGAYPPEVCIGCSTSGSVQSGFVIGRSHSVTRIQPDEKRNQVADTFAWSFGRHLLKFGADVNHVSDLQDQLFYDSPEYSYTSLADFIVDSNRPSARRYASFQQGFGRRRFQFATTDYNAFVQDDWRVNSRLTLNLGVRYEFERLPKPILPNPDEPRTATFPADANNFGPRAGFALDLTGRGKTALRGGYGIFYGRIIGSTIQNAMINTGVPGGQDTYFLYASNAVAPQYPNLLASAPPKTASPPSIVFFQKDFQNPLIHQADLVLEREIARGTSVSVSWLFSKGTDMPVFIDQNLSPPSGSVPIRYVGGPLDGQVIPMRVFFGDRPNPAYYQMTQISSRVRSNYNAGVAQLRRRMTRGLQVQASYTWSHAIDTQQSSTTFTTGNNLFDPYDLSTDKGNSSFNAPNRFVMHMVWAPKGRYGNRALGGLLNGWSFAPVFTAQSGRQRDTSVGGTAPFSSKTQAGGVNGSNGWNRVPALPRNYLRLPSPWNFDLRASRRVRIREKLTLELTAEAFNLLNHLNPTRMLTTMYRWGCGSPAPAGCTSNSSTPAMYYDSSVGQVTAASSYTLKERQIQLAARIQF
jgi:hypothetical protein